MSYSRTLSSPPVQGKPVFPATIDEYDVRTAKFVTYFVNQFVQKTLIPVILITTRLKFIEPCFGMPFATQ